MKLALTATVFLAGGISATTKIKTVLEEKASLFGTVDNDVWAEPGEGRRFFKNCASHRPAFNDKTLQTDYRLEALYAQCGEADRCWIEYNLLRKDEDCYETFSDSSKSSNCKPSQFLATIACDCKTEPHAGAPHGATAVREGDNIICRPNIEPRRTRLKKGDAGYDTLCGKKCNGVSCDVITKAVFVSGSRMATYEFNQCNCDEANNMLPRIFLNDKAEQETRCATKCLAGKYIDDRRIYTVDTPDHTNDQSHFYTCTPCPKGTYKTNPSVTWDQKCEPCPPGQTTAATGAETVGACSPDDSLPKASPTTAAPTTAEPTTASPTTAAPPTAAPTTVAPKTADPTTAAPTSEDPTVAPTAAPTTKGTQQPETTSRPRPTVNPRSSTSSLAFTFLTLAGVMLH